MVTYLILCFPYKLMSFQQRYRLAISHLLSGSVGGVGKPSGKGRPSTTSYQRRRIPQTLMTAKLPRSLPNSSNISSRILENFTISGWMQKAQNAKKWSGISPLSRSPASIGHRCVAPRGSGIFGSETSIIYKHS